MKVLGISCSPRRQRNTELLVLEGLKGAQHEGAEVEIYSVAGKNIQPCDGCDTCRETCRCHVNDDMQELYDKLLEADGIIYGTPAFFYGMTSQAKAIIDRTRCLRRPERCLVDKVAAGMVVGGSLGLISPLKDLYFYFVCNRMLPANFVAVYGDVRERPLGMKAAYDTGRQVVQMAAQKFRYPAEFMYRSPAYGTHTL